MKRVAAFFFCIVSSCSLASGQSLFVGIPDRAPVNGTPSGFKYLHFLAGLALGLSAAGLVGASPVAAGPGQDALFLPVVALSASAVGGIAKEVLDSTGFGDPSVSDIVVTMSGGLAAAVIVGYAQSLYPSTSSGVANEASLLLSGAAVAAIPVFIGFAGEVARFIGRMRARHG